MADAKNLNKVKLFLSADTKIGLVQKMLTNNAKNDMMYIYDPPIWDGQQWVTWFLADVTKVKNPRGNF